MTFNQSGFRIKYDLTYVSPQNYPTRRSSEDVVPPLEITSPSSSIAVRCLTLRCHCLRITAPLIPMLHCITAHVSTSPCHCLALLAHGRCSCGRQRRGAAVTSPSQGMCFPVSTFIFGMVQWASMRWTMSEVRDGNGVVATTRN